MDRKIRSQRSSQIREKERRWSFGGGIGRTERDGRTDADGRLNTVGAVGLLDTPEHDHACDFHYTLKTISLSPTLFLGLVWRLQQSLPICSTVVNDVTYGARFGPSYCVSPNSH